MTGRRPHAPLPDLTGYPVGAVLVDHDGDEHGWTQHAADWGPWRGWVLVVGKGFKARLRYDTGP